MSGIFCFRSWKPMKNTSLTIQKLPKILNWVLPHKKYRIIAKVRTVSKTIIETATRLLKNLTLNSEFLSKWLHAINDLLENDMIEKHKGRLSRATIPIIKRILKNQLK